MNELRALLAKILRTWAPGVVRRVKRRFERRSTIRLVRDVRRVDTLKVNVGSGSTRLDGWFNTDVGRHGDYHLDLLEPWPIRNVDYVYGDNVLEHLTLTQARTAFHHLFAALRGGGRLRFIVPDVQRTARMYLDDPKTLRLVMARHRRHGHDVVWPADVLRVVFVNVGHWQGYAWDWNSLSGELAAVGFTGLGRYSIGHSADPHLRGLETRTAPEDDLYTLVIEAVRP